MKLTSLEIKLERWGEHAGKYTGVANFDGDHGTLGIRMSPEIAGSFLALAGDLLIAHVEVAGKSLQTSIDVAVDRARIVVETPAEIAQRFTKDVKILTTPKSTPGISEGEEQ